MSRSLRIGLKSTPPFLGIRHAYRDRSKMIDALGPDLGRPVTMRSDDSEPADSPLARIFAETDDVFKLRHYLPVYESAFARTERMLEIGVDRGGSLNMWRQWMPKATIVGLDISPKASQYDDPNRDVHVRIGDQTDTTFLQEVLDEFGPFDTVLDDGGHTNEQMTTTFQYLFPRLAPGGVYLVEDVCANYWTPYRDTPNSFIDFTKWLMDAMHAHYLQMSSTLGILEGSPKRIAGAEVPFATTIIDRIEVVDSMVVVHRAPETKRLPRAVFH